MKFRRELAGCGRNFKSAALDWVKTREACSTLSRRKTLLNIRGSRARGAQRRDHAQGRRELAGARGSCRSACFPPVPALTSSALLRGKLQEAVGKTVIVENKVGSFGNIANEYVARSKPDGYTIYIAPANLLAIAPHLYTKLQYDPLNDFETVTDLFKLPFILIVSRRQPVQDAWRTYALI